MDDESRQMHVDSLNSQVSNHQSLKDCLPVIKNAGSSGKGFPYAPEDFPSPGDVWTWRVGRRYTHAGFWQDRSVHPPDRLQSSTGNKMLFRGRASLEQYIRKTFPDADVDAFFASFVWKIPCTDVAKDASLKIIKSTECSKSAAIVQPVYCKASNEMCRIKAKTGSALTPATCKICCSEPNFCRNCCCILCYKTIDWIYDCYSFIKCEALVDEKIICGHVAHIECALRAYLAGKVGGSIDLDAQYYCRCCDNKTDLLLHVEKIIKVSKSIDNRDDIGKVLNLGFCMLRGSKKERAEKLQNHIATSIEKLKHGVPSEDIWKKRSEISELEQGAGKAAKTSDIRHRLEQYKLLKASAKPKPPTSRPGDVVRYRPLLGVIEEDMQKRKRGRSSFEPSPGPQPPVQPIHDITEDTEFMPSSHPSENPTVTPIDRPGLDRNPFAGHPDLDLSFQDISFDVVTGEHLLRRNPMVRVLDEVKSLDLDLLTTRIVTMGDEAKANIDRVAEETRKLMGHHALLVKAGEEIVSANIRLRLKVADQAKQLADQAIQISQHEEASRRLKETMEEASRAELRKMEAACKERIDIAIATVDEVRRADLEQVEKLSGRLEAAELAQARLKEEMEEMRRSLQADRLRYRSERDVAIAKLLSSEARVREFEENEGMMDEMLQDVYFRTWKQGNLSWMDDYPRIMARIYLWALEEAKSGADKEGGAAFRMDVVTAQFSKEEKVAVKEGMRLLAAEEAGVQLGDEDQEVGVGGASGHHVGSSDPAVK